MASARRGSDSAHTKPVDPYKNDKVDLRNYLVGIGASYNGFREGLHGRDVVDEQCMNDEFSNSVQDIVHVLFTWDFNNIMKLINDFQNAYSGIVACDFGSSIQEIFSHCRSKHVCSFSHMWQRMQHDVMPIIVDVQDLISVFSLIGNDDIEGLEKDLKKAGFRFCGPTIVYAFMQAVGMVNDHLIGCPCHDRVAALSEPPQSK